MIVIRSIILRLFSAVLVLFVAAGAGQGIPPTVQAARPPSAAAPASLLQFTAAGHILGFEPGGLYVAAGSHALRITFQGANPVTPAAAQGQPAPHSAPAAAPSSPSAVRGLSSVTWRNLWNGVTLTYQAAAGAIAESVYTLAPGAPADPIRLVYNVPARLNPDGSLTLTFQAGQMTESAPTAWQEINGQRLPVSAAYRLEPGAAGQAQVGYTLGRYDPAYGVTIDPVLMWNGFAGSVDNDTATGIALDNSQNIYIVGDSYKTWGSPTRPYQYGEDVYVAKLNQAGGLVWNTFLGGQTDDLGNGIAYSAYDGYIYVVGTSSSAWGVPPSMNYNGGNDAFVAKLSVIDGYLAWNAFLGGSGNDYGQAITVDGVNGWVLVAGISYFTWGSPVQAIHGAEDTFVARLYSTGSISMLTFVGGAGNDEPVAIATDVYARAYVTGFSDATWGPTPARAYTGGRDAYVTMLNYDGTLAWNTFLGGTGDDQGSAITTDSNFNTYVVGNSLAAWGSPVRAFSGAEDAFAARLDNHGNLVWVTFLGGSGYSSAGGVALDANGYVYVSGTSDSTWGTPVTAYSANSDMFAAKLDSSGRVQWNTFAGGAGYDSASGIVVDSLGYIYLSGASDAAWGGAVTFSGGSDGAGVKLDSGGSLVWVRFLGAGGDDIAAAVSFDGSGNIIVAGYSDMRWPTTSYGSGQPIRDYSYQEDGFVAKLSSSGTLLWHTFLGGTQNDYIKAVTVDSSGFIYVAGYSFGTWGSPLRPFSIAVDAFVAELNPNGVLQWNTFLGGQGLDMASGIALDTYGNIYVCGSSSATWGAPLNAYSGGYDGFVAQLNPNGLLQWNTFVGGAANDYLESIAILTPDIYLGGESYASWGAPLNPYSGGEDGLVVDMSTSGGVAWHTFLGGAGDDNVASITVSSSDVVYVTGSSTAAWGAAPNRAFSGNSDIFVAALNLLGEIGWNTFLGGAGYDYGNGIALQGSSLLVTGTSSVSWGSPTIPYSANDDASVAQLTTGGSLLWNTFLGGSGYDDGNGIAVEANGIFAVAGASNAAWGPGASTFNGGYDAFVATLVLPQHRYLPLMRRH